MNEILPAPEIQRRFTAVFDGGRVYPQDRRWALAVCGLTVARIAELAGMPQSRSAVSEVISGQRQARHIRQVIARATGLSVSRLWPPQQFQGG